MQFSVIVCAIIHLGMLVYALESGCFQKAGKETLLEAIGEKKPKKRLEYHPSHQQQNVEKPDFLKPVDTECPGSGASRGGTQTETEAPEEIQQPASGSNRTSADAGGR